MGELVQLRAPRKSQAQQRLISKTTIKVGAASGEMSPEERVACHARIETLKSCIKENNEILRLEGYFETSCEIVKLKPNNRK